MDLRKEKTIQRIKDGFKKLIKEKSYHDITIQDILDVSDTGRTTFYIHYKSKDEVLKSILDEIFDHVIHPNVEVGHDFKGDNSFLTLLNHTLYHFKDDKDLLQAILKSESKELFISFLSNHLSSLIEDRMIPYYSADNVPEEILLNHLSSSLTNIILWWISKNNCIDSPEEISYYYFSLIMPALTTKGFSYTISDKIKELS